MTELLDIIKEISVRANEAKKPAEFCVGAVVSANPLKIKLNDKIIIEEDMLLLAKEVTNHYIYMTCVGELDYEDIENYDDFKARKKYAVYNALDVGEKVIMARAVGGQLFYVLGRLG